MATIAACKPGAIGGFSSPPELPQGDYGQFLADNCVVDEWQGPSTYLATILPKRAQPSRTNHILTRSGFLAIVCVGFALSGWLLGYGLVFFPLAAVAGLAAYICLNRWLAKQDHRSGILRFAERIRRAIAYEGDMDSHAS